MNILSPQDLLLLHDEQLRTAAELDGAADPGRIGPLWVGRFGSAGFVSYRDLAGIDAAGIDDLIAAVLARFAADPAVVEVEWKTRGHDAVPFLADRLLAARLVSGALTLLGEQFAAGSDEGHYVGLVRGEIRHSPLSGLANDVDVTFRRPREQWWLALRPVLEAVSNPPQ